VALAAATYLIRSLRSHLLPPQAGGEGLWDTSLSTETSFLETPPSLPHIERTLKAVKAGRGGQGWSQTLKLRNKANFPNPINVPPL
jgi:hypothetical protein